MHDVSLRGLAIGAAIIFIGILASLGIARLFVRPVEIKAPSHPVLQTASGQDLAAFRREKDERLHSRGRLEGDAKHMHIPIDEAMRRLAKQ